ncbi:D-alanyl-D-alanine carboxypeptidase [Streptomyces vinaceus]|uniref:D-alanyl-D-alanine carboxypeptidase n=1 Tax=Streptomyces vinaceus TaxID=1960 RepID=UPI00368A1742
MKAVAVAGGSPDTPKSPETEGTELPEAQHTPTETAPDDASRGGTAAAADAGADAEADAARKTGRAGDAEPEAGTEVAGAAGTESDEDAPTEPAAKPEAEPQAGDARGAGAEGSARGDAVARDGLEADAARDATVADADADADGDGDAVRGAGRSEGAAGAVADAEADADADAGTEVAGAGGAGSDEDAPAEPAAKAGAGPEAAHAPEAVGAGETAPETGVQRGEEAAPEPGAAATDGDVAESDAAVGGTDAGDPEVEGTDVPGRAPRAEGDGGSVRGGRGAGVAEQQGGESAEGPGPGDGAGRVPSWARDDESDAERTSQFVALKDLDAPAEKTPWPRAAAPNRAPGRTATPTATPTTAPAPAPKPGSPAGLAPGRGAGPARTPSAPAAASAGPAPVVEPTREVPVPPRPPLDLLAELTNNPPPPETPRRTAVRRVKIWTPILLLLAGAAIGGQLLRPLPAPRIVAAEQTHTLDGQFSVPWPAKGQGAVRVPGSGDIGAFGEQKPVPTASVAKVMTAYVILKNHPLRKTEAGPQIEIDAKAVADGNSDHESRVEGLVAGTKFSQQDMLKMLMIPSGNNVARLLARWDTGTDSEAAFVEKMNAAARELGMKNTTYTDPSGLDAATVSTAADQLKLAEAVMKDEAFRAVVALPSAEIKGLSKTLINNNTLLSVNGLSVRGIKTGSSTPAGGTLMWAAYKSVGDETPLILGTLMDQHADGPDIDGADSLKLVLANSKKIIESVRQALDSAPAVRKGQTVGHVDDGLGGRTPLVATKDLKVIGVPGQQLQLTLRPGAAGTPHAAKAGTEVGVLTVGTGEGAKTVPVALGTSLAEPSFTTRVTRLR